MDFGKFLFEQSKKTKLQKKKSKQVQLKEIKMRPATDIGDYNTKVRKAIDFLKDGDKVKFTIRFRGRELAHQDIGITLLKRVEQDIAEYGTVEQRPKKEDRQIIMVIGPKKNNTNKGEKK
jgi:translation initiation factor IF-3